MTRLLDRRSFLRAAGAAAAAASFAPRLRIGRARGANDFLTRHVVVVAIGGGLRLSESLGMAEGATLPNLFGQTPLVAGFGASPAGAPRIAQEYAAAVRPLVTPAPLATPLHTQGTLVTNLRYAEGAPGHLQGQACLFTGAYNNIENRGDARAPAPTLFELHRREKNAPATDAWYVSTVGGFYRAIQSSAHPEFGPRFGGSFLQPPGSLSAILPIVTSGRRKVVFDASLSLPIIEDPDDERRAAERLTAVLDGNTRAYAADEPVFRSTPDENGAIEAHLGGFYADPTYQAYYPDSVAIGTVKPDGGLDPTGDALTTYHAERLLARFKPAVMCMTLLDIDAAHTDFNGYLRGQIIADACVRHLWEMIQATDGLRDQTTMIVLPEHGRHLFHNGQNPDSLGRSGLDHGQGDDGDRNVWMLALGPDVKAGQVLAPTGVAQTGRSSGRYESIDATMLAATLLGYGDLMTGELSGLGMRPGIVPAEVLR